MIVIDFEEWNYFDPPGPYEDDHGGVAFQPSVFKNPRRASS